MLRSNSRIKSYLTSSEIDFLNYASEAFCRVLPHVAIRSWTEGSNSPTSSVWESSARTGIKVTLSIQAPDPNITRSVSTIVTRKSVVRSGGHQAPATLDIREFDLCKKIAFRLSSVLSRRYDASTINAIRDRFDEAVVSEHIQAHHALKLNVAEVFESLHRLSQQTYENHAISFGCLLDPSQNKPDTAIFPRSMLRSKKHKALSDGFRTAYHISSQGGLAGFEDLDSFEFGTGGHRDRFFPEWAKSIAAASQEDICGLCLSRQGDILVFDRGTMRLTYRFGRWQYWNHAHIVSLLKERARAQRVSPQQVGRVVATIYRAALDVAFRRSGGLFIVLRNRRNLRSIVRSGDAIDDHNRN